jgi:hypothetical protein
LFTHSFVKHPRKISNDPENLADDIAKNLNFYKRQESIDSDATNIDQIIGTNAKIYFYLFMENSFFFLSR